MNIDKEVQAAFQYYEEGKLQEALQICEKIILKKPKQFDALHLLGIIHNRIGHYDLSIQYMQKAIQSDPHVADAYFNLGVSFKRKGQDREAIICYQKALQLDPNFSEALSNLGGIFQEHAQYNEAIRCLETALKLNPILAEAYSNLGTVLKELGRVDEAEICYRKALRSRLEFSSCQSNLLFLLHFNPRHDAQNIFSEHLGFAGKYEQPLAASVQPHTNERIYDRRLKIGYVSPDFRRHSVAYFIEPVIAAHNRKNVEVFCYSSSASEDEVTLRIRSYTDNWRDITTMSDAAAAEIIRRDGIDILVDLAGHTAHNRILLFALKPAPVQASWIGYPATTGLSNMDYKIVDNFTDPQGMTEKFYTEKLIRMSGCFLCYLPDKESPKVDSLPAVKSGHVTFGSFNDFAKISPEVISVWREILKAIPDSNLVIKAKGLSDQKTCQMFMDRFAQRDIKPERIALNSFKPTTKEHLNMYNKVDISLDTFPYNGTTTTCEALWMGVPVITLAGHTHASRMGVSLLSNIGLPELVASSYDEYRKMAVSLSADMQRLATLREVLRNKMADSPLTDAKRFAADLENCYRKMWETWCGAGRLSS